MSYEIVYSKQFLDTGDGRIIPLVLIGSNNCYSTERDIRGRTYERRERSWNPIFRKDLLSNIAATSDDIIEVAESWTGGQYQEHFKQNGKWIDDKGLRNFVKNGIKKAKTVEQLSEENTYPIYLSGYFSVWYKIGKKISELEKLENKTEGNYIIRSSKDLIEFLEAADKRLGEKKENERVYICLEFPTDKAVPYPKNKRERIPKKRPDEYWTIQREDGLYLERLTKTGAKLTPSTICSFL